MWKRLVICVTYTTWDLIIFVGNRRCDLYFFTAFIIYIHIPPWLSCKIRIVVMGILFNTSGIILTKSLLLLNFRKTTVCISLPVCYLQSTFVKTRYFMDDYKTYQLVYYQCDYGIIITKQFVLYHMILNRRILLDVFFSLHCI